jgi:serine/threonine-protein kinase/serine/threonine-protein kinase PpkA
MRLDLEVALRKHLPNTLFTRLFAHQYLVNLTEIPWADYDLIIIAYPFTLTQLTPLLNAIKQSRPAPLIIIYTNTTDEGRQLLKLGADGYQLFSETAGNLTAKLDKILEIKRATQQYPIKLEHWHLQELIHHSENALIYALEDEQGKPAILKRFKLNMAQLSPALINEFMQDVYTLQSLDQYGLVKIYETGINHNSLYFVMEYIEGQTLKYWLEHSHISLKQRLDWFRQITEALKQIHNASLLHRDLKAANVFVRPDKSIVLLDFGMETQLLIKAGFLREDEIYCAPHYISPERILGENASISSDLYALGVILYELLVGHRPFEANSLNEILKKHALAPIPALPKQLAAFQPLLTGLLAKFPEDRLQSCEEVQQLLQQLP